MTVALFVILTHTTAALLLGWGYFRRYAIDRPPIGVFNLWDVTLMIGGIVLVPYLYLVLPAWLVASLLALGILSMMTLRCNTIAKCRKVDPWRERPSPPIPLSQFGRGGVATATGVRDRGAMFLYFAIIERSNRA